MMPRTPSRFTQSDIARALRAIAQSGEDMAVEIYRDGTIRIVSAKGAAVKAHDQVEITL